MAKSPPTMMSKNNLLQTMHGNYDRFTGWVQRRKYDLEHASSFYCIYNISFPRIEGTHGFSLGYSQD